MVNGEMVEPVSILTIHHFSIHHSPD